MNNISVLGRILGSSVRAYRLVEDRRLSQSLRNEGVLERYAPRGSGCIPKIQRRKSKQ